MKLLSRKVLQKIFGVLAGFSMLLLVYYIYLSIYFYQAVRQLKPEGMEDLPDMLGNFWIVIVSAITLHIVKGSVTCLTKGLFKPYCKDQDRPDLVEKRAYKAS